MRAIGAAILATTMFVSGAFAATDTPVAPLPAGKPAGTHQAALEAGGVWLVVGFLVVAGAIAAVASTTQGNSSSSTGTSG